VHDLHRVAAECFAQIAAHSQAGSVANSQQARRTSEYDRIVERFNSRNERKSPSHSTIADDHCHGNALTWRANAHTCAPSPRPSQIPR
jgi:phage-related minor tail protein